MATSELRPERSEGEALYVCRGRKFQAEGTASTKALGQKRDMDAAANIAEESEHQMEHQRLSSG